jgi:malonyl-CoA/methylmalonyl-CoA synthetase
MSEPPDRFTWHHAAMSNELLQRAEGFAHRVALRGDAGEHTYGELLAAADRLARTLPGEEDADLQGARIVSGLVRGADWVACQWAVWRRGGILVPVHPGYPEAELSYIVEDAAPRALLRSGEQGAEVRLVPPSDDARDASAGAAGDAMMLYTSGTTARPKGVLITHDNLTAQIGTLVRAWEWRADDRILHVLPLHHVHGIVNALCCAQWVGACCEFAPPRPRAIWQRLASGDITLFMAVPTIYRRLIDAWEAAGREERERWSEGAAGVRLMVSGSAALPVPTLERWEEITGHRLLERYGMTEIGMALGNPLHGERRAGTVGQPFAGVEARIVDDDGQEAAPGAQGEIQVRGAQVFREYWRRPDETAAAFTADGWFRTGDEGVVEDGYWRIVGRRSVDIIKSGGYKISALEIEAVLRRHEAVADAAVVGVPDEEWGERVCAVVTPAGGSPDGDALRAWCKEQLAAYKVPKDLRVVDRLPRNAMGKVTKPTLHRLFSDAE